MELRLFFTTKIGQIYISLLALRFISLIFSFVRLIIM